MLVEDERGVLKMTAGVVLFVWRWWMTKKIGMNMRAIHGPVPFYQKLIAGPVDTFMKHLKVKQPAWRIGWSVTNNPAFYQAGNEDEDMRTDLFEERPDLDDPITIENAETRLFYRVERQTFVRLPK